MAFLETFLNWCSKYNNEKFFELGKLLDYPPVGAALFVDVNCKTFSLPRKWSCNEQRGLEIECKWFVPPTRSRQHRRVRRKYSESRRSFQFKSLFVRVLPESCRHSRASLFTSFWIGEFISIFNNFLQCHDDSSLFTLNLFHNRGKVARRT